MDLQNIFLTVWNMSLTGSIIIGFVLLARLMLRKAPKVFSYALWSVVLFRLLCPVSISSVFSVLNLTKAAEPASQSVVTTMDYSAVVMPEFIPVVENEQEIEEPIIVAPDYQEPQIEDSVIPDDGMEFPEAPDAVFPQASAEPAHEPIHYAVLLWLVGLGVMLVYNVTSCIRLLRQIEGAVPLRKELYLADYISTAFVLGIINPKIYLPSYLSKEERGYIIAHERCHIKRMDHVFRLLAYIALCLHWFNPLVWLAFVLSGKDMEMSCDEAVIRMYGPRIRAEYSQSLLRLATGRRSFALTPLAFGEGDTKERVINMSKWKKPRLWVIICALVSCIGILVACGTNPTTKISMEEDSAETVPAEHLTEPTVLVPLWNESTDLKQVCIDAVDGLLHAESYYLQYQTEVDMNGGGYYVLNYRRHGKYELVFSQDQDLYGSLLLYGADYASFYGDYWVWNGARNGMGANETLMRWSPNFIVPTKIWAEGNTISLEGTWPDRLRDDRYYTGTITYCFDSDGSLQKMHREYMLMQGDTAVDGTNDQFVVMNETAADTLTTIKAVAVQCITAEELEKKRFEQKVVSDIPSNKTMYDTDYELGAGQMGWAFFDQEIKFKYGAVSDDGKTATVTHYVTADGVKSVVAEDAFWLEKFVDGKWQYVDKNLIAVPIEKRNVETEGFHELSYHMDWSDTYGKLPAGFYRIGRYHTVTMVTGESETRPCYAKFRVMGDDWDVLLKKCSEAVAELYCRDSYHIVVHEYLTDYADPEDKLGFGYKPYTIETHSWKVGRDFVEDVRYIDRQDPSFLHGRRGSMQRDYICYNLEWTGKEPDSPLSFWGTNTYYTPSIERDLDYKFLWIDSLVEDVKENGNRISVFLTDDLRSVRQEYVYTFDKNGNIARIDLLHHPVEGSERVMETVMDCTLEVQDTSEKEIRQMIESQDVSKPVSFSYALDLEEYPDAQKTGFVNTSSRKITTMEDAIALADKECTMEAQDGREKPYNMTEVHFDATAKIWKVVFRFSQNIDGDQAIYINDQGITQMIVTFTEENDPDNIG